MKSLNNWDEADDPVIIEAGRSSYWLFSLYKANGKAAAIAVDAVARFKLSEAADSETPTLDIDSIAALDGGSICLITTTGTDESAPAQIKVCFAQADTADLDAGEYFGELGIVDTGETNPADAFKRIASGTVIVRASPGGDTGLT